MIKIEGKTIYINRGDSQTFELKIPISDTEFYQFKTSDVIKFGVYEANGLNKNALILKTIVPESPTDSIKIILLKNDTTIGELRNTKTTFWYEITLNDNTIVGYDENGAKEFILYPEGSDIK